MKLFQAFLLIFALVVNTLELEGGNDLSASASNVSEYQVAHDLTTGHDALDSHQTDDHDASHDKECHRCHLGHCLFGLVTDQAMAFPVPVGTAIFAVTTDVAEVFLPSLKRPPIA